MLVTTLVLLQAKSIHPRHFQWKYSHLRGGHGSTEDYGLWWCDGGLWFVGQPRFILWKGGETNPTCIGVSWHVRKIPCGIPYDPRAYVQIPEWIVRTFLAREGAKPKLTTSCLLWLDSECTKIFGRCSTRPVPWRIVANWWKCSTNVLLKKVWLLKSKFKKPWRKTNRTLLKSCKVLISSLCSQPMNIDGLLSPQTKPSLLNNTRQVLFCLSLSLKIVSVSVWLVASERRYSKDGYQPVRKYDWASWRAPNCDFVSYNSFPSSSPFAEWLPEEASSWE